MSKIAGRRAALTSGRPLVVLADGPWANRWYWADQFAAMQESARRYAVTHPAGQLAGYIPTGEPPPPHPDAADSTVPARVFRWRPDYGAVTTPRATP